MSVAVYSNDIIQVLWALSQRNQFKQDNLERNGGSYVAGHFRNGRFWAQIKKRD